jgi:hypothetical protein
MSKKTLEEAAYLLNVSPRQLARYESAGPEGTTPPDEIVAAMVRVYDAPYLAYLHIMGTPVGRMLLPEGVGQVPLINAVARFNVETARYMVRAMEAQAAALDGVIQPEERYIWDEVISMMDSIVAAALEVRFATQKGGM